MSQSRFMSLESAAVTEPASNQLFKPLWVTADAASNTIVLSLPFMYQFTVPSLASAPTP